MFESEDSHKLKVLADWFDMEERTGRWKKGNTEVQDDLRRMAKVIDEIPDIYTNVKDLYEEVNSGNLEDDNTTRWPEIRDILKRLK